MIEWLIVLILFIVVVYLLYTVFKLRSESGQQAMKLFEDWRTKEQDQYQKWKEKDLQSLSEEKANILFASWKSAEEKEIREDAIKRSHDVIKGKITEHLVPFFSEFPYHPKDARFLGTPVDLIVFDGLSEDHVKDIVFIEVKSGKKASLTTRERSVRDCIQEGHIQYQVLHLPIDGENNESQTMQIK